MSAGGVVVVVGGGQQEHQRQSISTPGLFFFVDLSTWRLLMGIPASSRSEKQLGSVKKLRV